MPSIDPKPPKPPAPLNGTGKILRSPIQPGDPPERDDVGIVPYIPAELHTIQRKTMKPSGGGRLVAAPTSLL